MIIATFGPSTGWVGKTVSYENGVFALEGEGPISAADVLAYDREGHLSWAYAGLREWAEQVARGGVAPEPVVVPLSVVAGAAPVPVAVAGVRPAQGKKRFPVWAIVLIAVAAAFSLVLLFAVFFLPVRSETSSGSSPGSTSSSAIWSAQDSATTCLLYTSPSPRDRTRSRMPSSA